MRNSIFIILLLLGSNAIIAQSTEPRGKIQQPKTFKEKAHNFFLSGRLLKATEQRDTLDHITKRFQADTTDRGSAYRSLDSAYHVLDSMYKAELQKSASLENKLKHLQRDFTEMNARYTELIRNNLSKTEQLNLALRDKELALKEKADLLIDRERRLTELENMKRSQDSITSLIHDLVQKALLSFNSDELTVEMKNGKVYVSMSDKLLFKSGSAEVEEKGKEAIKQLAEVMNKNKDIDMMIEGHTDNKPIKSAQFADNWELSTARANNIIRLLSNTHQVDPKRLTAAGRGEFQPKVSNETPEGRAKNRRTEIILSPKLDQLYKLLGSPMK